MWYNYALNTFEGCADTTNGLDRHTPTICIISIIHIINNDNDNDDSINNNSNINRNNSPPIKSFDFRGIDSSKLLSLKGGNSHAGRI